MAGFTQLSIELFLSVSWVRGHDDFQLYILIAAPSASFVQTLSSQSQSLTALRARWYFYFCFSFNCWDLYSRSQYSLRRRNRNLSGDVIARHIKDRMRLDLQPYVQ